MSDNTRGRRFHFFNGHTCLNGDGVKSDGFKSDSFRPILESGQTTGMSFAASVKAVR